MDTPYTCRICSCQSQSPECVRVPGATRDVKDETFTVWHCSHCSTLNALESVDFPKIYKNYPVQRQKYDLFAKCMFAKRLKILIELGLKPNHTVLDYGCGSGYFVRYLREKNYRCHGYDPFNINHCDKKVLEDRYDVVTCQDVLEHLDEPEQLLRQLLEHVTPNGRLIIGMPYADHVNLHETLDQIGVLHQPFHRFVISKQAIEKFFCLGEWKLNKVLFDSYFDTFVPFVNTMFLIHLIKSGQGPMDMAFEPIPVSHFVRHPGLFFWGFFGRLFVRSWDFFAVMMREESPLRHPSKTETVGETTGDVLG